MPSVGKTTAANKIAKKFHLKHLAGGDMLKEMALSRGYRPSGSDWWDSKEGMEFLSERKRNPDFDKEVDRRLIANLRKGGVVITSYPIPWITSQGLKMWFEASQKTRAKRLAGRDSIPLGTALRVIKKRDLENKRIYRKIYNIRFGTDLSPFHFVIDTENMTAVEVAVAACSLVSEFSGKSFLERKRKQ
jgi:CMP/dCMP kinase